jgi:hypothetical protein
MKIEKLILMLLIALSLKCFANDETFGIAVSTKEGICASFGESHPKIGSTITIIETQSPQYFIEGTLTAETESCINLQNAQISGPYFTVSTFKKINTPFVGLVVHGGKKFSNIDNEVLLSTSSEKQVYFRSCTSSEGVHMSAWLDEPLKGERLWHLYYYLGYDLESTCEVSEIAM